MLPETSPRLKKLCQAILKGYPDEESLETLLFDEMEITYQTIVEGANYENRVFKLIQSLEAQGTIGDLIKVIVADRPDNQEIQKMREEFPELFTQETEDTITDEKKPHLQKVPRKDPEVKIAEVYQPLSRFLQTLTPFDFETKTLNPRGEVIRTETKTASFFSQPLGSQAQPLEMVAIPGGEFTMGSPSTEKGHRSSEAPQRLVQVPPFYMSKFPITQAQWQEIATQPKVEVDLNPTPSYFKGSGRPVERVNWYEAVEFCNRLTNLVEGKLIYRLPSEAEWEYACRGGTNTPFAFGETMTGELANYDSTKTFAEEKPVKSKRGTTDVGKFPPNAFGLYDMHGQVWEWCEDDWHENYEGAPTDGSAWIKSGKNAQKIPYSVLRGGYCSDDPVNCRSARRIGSDGRAFRNSDVGFRVLCVVGRTQ